MPRERAKAVKTYCTASAKRKRHLSRLLQSSICCSCMAGICVQVPVARRDKYERHIREYWVDVETVGTLAQSMEEEVTQSYEIVDFDCALPAPALGSSPKPYLDEPMDDSSREDDEGAWESEGDDDEDDAASSKKRRRKDSATPSSDKKKKKRSRRKQQDQEHQLEEALEAHILLAVLTI